MTEQKEWVSVSGDLREKWATEQENLRNLVIQRDDRDWDAAANFTVGGLDISFVKGTDVACAGLVVCEVPSFAVVFEDYEIVSMTAPYVPGFLSFREKDHLVKLLNRYRSTDRRALDLIMVDGNGILHPRKFGVACHIGLEADTPTIGVAKNEFKTACPESLARPVLELPHAGSMQELLGDDGCVMGYAVRTTGGSTKPVYVSVGHKISLSSAVKLVLRSSLKRVPEPVRQADIRTREYLRKHGPPTP